MDGETICQGLQGRHQTRRNQIRQIPNAMGYIQEDRVAFDLLEYERDIDFAQNSLDQCRDELLAVDGGQLVRGHETRVAADVGEDDD